MENEGLSRVVVLWRPRAHGTGERCQTEVLVVIHCCGCDTHLSKVNHIKRGIKQYTACSGLVRLSLSGSEQISVFLFLICCLA